MEPSSFDTQAGRGEAALPLTRGCDPAQAYRPAERNNLGNPVNRKSG